MKKEENMKFTEVEALTILKYLLEIKFDLVWEGKLRRDIMNRVERNPLEIGHFFEFLEIEKEKKRLRPENNRADRNH